MEAKHILITGGAGLVGSHLCKRLLADGHRVTCIDNTVGGGCVTLKGLLDHPSFEYIRHDVVHPFRMRADLFFALAASTSPLQIRQNPVQTLRTHLIGTINTLEAAHRSLAPVVFASSGDVYGNSRMSTLSEDYWGNVNTLGSVCSSEEGKRAAESICYAYQKQLNLDVKIARIFNTYGQGSTVEDLRVIPRFIVNALKNRDLVIYGSGDQTRSFCYVDDIVEGLLRMASLRPDEHYNPINLGSDKQITIHALAEKILRMTGSSSKIVRLKTMPDDPRHKIPEIAKARQLLGWEPHVTLDEGLRRTIDYYHNLLAQANPHFPCISWIEMC